MKKFVILTLVLLLLPTIILAADEVTFTADTNFMVAGITLVVKSGSICDQIVANAGNLEVTLSTNSNVVIVSADRKSLNLSSNVASIVCEVSQSAVTLPGQSTVTTVTVTPGSDQCSGGSGSVGSGGVSTPTPPVVSMPTTSTGAVTATASGGGKTTLTTSENATAKVEIPVNTVTTDTAVTISAQAKADITVSRPVPSAREVVGGYVYDYTAKTGQTAVTNFSKTLTLTFTYTDAQIKGLDESALKVYYWKESASQWVSLTTTVDAANNKLTAETDHLTYFAILGRKTGETAVETTTEETSAAVIVDGDLIRNPNAAGDAQYDIYIVKLVGSKKFRRLVLSPHVFNSYGHLKWENVKTIAQATMDMYAVSDIVRCQDSDFAVDDPKVYKLIADGDTGAKQHLNMTAAQFEAKGYDWDSIYIINKTDRDAYATGSDITADGSDYSSSGSSIKILAATLRVRSLPSLSGTVLTTVKAGETYAILDESEGWYKITANNKTGWCYGGDAGGYAKKQ